MTTLSQLVDDMVKEFLRPGMVLELTSYVNQVVRELHSDPVNKSAMQYFANRLEDQITTTLDTGFVWAVPKAYLLQRIEAVYYETVGMYADPTSPGHVYNRSGNAQSDYYYYRTGDSLAFGGYGGLGAVIKVSYFSYPMGLSYYLTGSAPATWDIVTQSYTYDPAYIGNETAALALTTHWVLERHEELIKQGVRAKVYARLGRTEQGKTAYAMYMGMRSSMIMSESTQGGITYG